MKKKKSNVENERGRCAIFHQPTLSSTFLSSFLPNLEEKTIISQMVGSGRKLLDPTIFSPYASLTKHHFSCPIPIIYSLLSPLYFSLQPIMLKTLGVLLDAVNPYRFKVKVILKMFI